MARITREALDNFQSYDFAYFGLKDDKDKAEVRLLYKSLDDLSNQFDAVHEVEVNGKKKYVDCLRATGTESLDVCPFCKAGMKPKIKLFLQLYHFTTKNSEGKILNAKENVVIWERGSTIIKDLEGDIEDDIKGDLVSNVIGIKRIGKPKDKDTKYKFKVLESDDTTLEEFKEDLEAVELRGTDKGLILVKTAEDMDYYLEHGDFKKSSGDGAGKRTDSLSRRRGSRQSEVSEEEIPF